MKQIETQYSVEPSETQYSVYYHGSIEWSGELDRKHFLSSQFPFYTQPNHLLYENLFKGRQSQLVYYFKGLVWMIHSGNTNSQILQKLGLSQAQISDTQAAGGGILFNHNQ